MDSEASDSLEEKINNIISEYGYKAVQQSLLEFKEKEEDNSEESNNTDEESSKKIYVKRPKKPKYVTINLSSYKLLDINARKNFVLIISDSKFIKKCKNNNNFIYIYDSTTNKALTQDEVAWVIEAEVSPEINAVIDVTYPPIFCKNFALEKTHRGYEKNGLTRYLHLHCNFNPTNQDEKSTSYILHLTFTYKNKFIWQMQEPLKFRTSRKISTT